MFWKINNFHFLINKEKPKSWRLFVTSTELRCAVLYYSAVQYSAVQYSTVQYSTVQYSTVQYSTVQYSTVRYSTVYSASTSVDGIEARMKQFNPT